MCRVLQLAFLQVQHLTMLSVEVHAASRGSLLPDPEYDPVLFICYYLHDDWPEPITGEVREKVGVLAVDLGKPGTLKGSLKNMSSPVKENTQSSPAKGKSPLKRKSPLKGNYIRKGQALTKGSSSHDTASPIKGHPIAAQSVVLEQDDRPYLDHCGLRVAVSYAETELDLFEQLVKLIREADPDILVGYEIQMSSWGYLNERATNLGFNLIGQICRIPGTIIYQSFLLRCLPLILLTDFVIKQSLCPV